MDKPAHGPPPRAIDVGSRSRGSASVVRRAPALPKGEGAAVESERYRSQSVQVTAVEVAKACTIFLNYTSEYGLGLPTMSRTFTNEEKRRVQLHSDWGIIGSPNPTRNFQANDDADISRAKRLLGHLQKVGRLDCKISCDK